MIYLNKELLKLLKLDKLIQIKFNKNIIKLELEQKIQKKKIQN